MISGMCIMASVWDLGKYGVSRGASFAILTWNVTQVFEVAENEAYDQPAHPLI